MSIRGDNRDYSGDSSRRLCGLAWVTTSFSTFDLVGREQSVHHDDAV